MGGLCWAVQHDPCCVGVKPCFWGSLAAGCSCRKVLCFKQAFRKKKSREVAVLILAERREPVKQAY